MLGTIVNAGAIIAGSLLGAMLKDGLPERYRVTVMQSLGLAVVLIGVRSALLSSDLLVIIFSLVIGSLLGELIRIEDHLNWLGKTLEQRFSRTGGKFASGFVTASLIFCVGSMAIVGSLESGLTGNHQTLFAKSVIDGLASIVFASTMGIGVLFAAISVFLYQGTITLTAVLIKPYLTPEVINQMSAVGGVLIIAIGFSLLEIKILKIGNMLPAIFMPLLYFIVMNFS